MAKPEAVQNLDSVQSDLKASTVHANSRTLFLDPQAAKQATDACRGAIDAIKAIQGQLHKLSTDGYLNGFRSSETLSSERIEQKVGKEFDHAPAGSYGKALSEHIAALKEFENALISAGKAYQETDFEGREAFTRIASWR